MELVDQYGRPFRKSEWEEHAQSLLSSRRFGGAITAPMLPGSHPFLTELDPGYEGAPADFQSYLPFIDTTSGEERAAGSGVYAPSIVDSGSGGTGVNPNLFNERFARRNPIAELSKPHDTVSIMSQSMKYAEDNYIVNTGIKVKRNFAHKGLTILGAATTKAHYEAEFKRLKMRRIISYSLRYYWTCGRVVVFWGDKRPIKGLNILDPRFIIVRRILNETMVLLKPDPRWKSILESTDKERAPIKKFLLRAIPRYWLSWIVQDRPIPLNPGEYALIENDLSLFSARGIADTVGGVPLSAAFDALATHKMMMAGDFSVAWMMKNMIALVSIGDPSIEKEKYTRADQTELQKLYNAFQRPEWAMWAYVDPTVNIRYIAPDPKLFDQAKFAESTKQIERVMGVPAVFSDGGGDYATGSLSMRSFEEEINFGRDDIEEQLLDELAPHLRDGYSRRQAGTKDPTYGWDQNCLKDPRAIMDEITGKYDRGACSLRSLIEGKIQDYATELQRKKEELADLGTWRPQWDQNHGTVTTDKPIAEMQAKSAMDIALQRNNARASTDTGGRPRTTDKPTHEGATGGRTPRPSTS